MSTMERILAPFGVHKQVAWPLAWCSGASLLSHTSSHDSSRALHSQHLTGLARGIPTASGAVRVLWAPFGRACLINTGTDGFAVACASMSQLGNVAQTSTTCKWC